MNSRFEPRFWLVVPTGGPHVRYRVCQLLQFPDAPDECDVPTEDGPQSGIRVDAVAHLRQILGASIWRELAVYRCFPHTRQALRWQKVKGRMSRGARYARKPRRRPKPKTKAKAA